MSLRIVTCNASSIVGIRNFGDELLSDLYQSWITTTDVPATASHLSITQFGGLTNADRATLDDASCVIFTGGGYFADGDTGSRHQVRRHLRALRNRQVYWTVFRRAQRMGIPCAVMGLEVGPLTNPMYRRAVRKILTAAQMVVVRNEESRHHMSEILGVDRRAVVYLDSALALDRANLDEPSTNGSPFSKQPTEGANETRIGLHLHKLGGDVTEADCLSLVRNILSLACAKRPVRLFFIHDQLKNDTHPARSIRAQQVILNEFPETIVVPYHRPQDTVDTIGAMDLLVTTKLHVGVVGRALEVPVLSLGTHPKIRRFYESIGESDCCGSAQAFAAGSLPARFQSGLASGQGRIRAGVSPQAKESAQANRDAIRDLLQGLDR